MRIESKLSIPSFEPFPYPFLPSFHKFYELSMHQKCAFAVSDKNIAMPISLYRGRWIHTVQILASPMRFEGQISPSEEEEIFNEFVEYSRTNNLAHRVLPPLGGSLFKSVPHGSKYCQYGTFQLDLANQSVEKLFSRMNSNYRNEIQKAEEQIDIKYGEDQIQGFHTLYSETMSRAHKFAHPLSYVIDFYKYLGPQNVECAVAYHQGRAVGGMLVPFTQYAAYYYLGGSSATQEVPGAIKFLHWEVMKRMKQKSVSLFDQMGALLSDVEGTKTEGIQKFKQRFGGELRTGYIWKADLNKCRTASFDFVFATQRLLKGQFPIKSRDFIDVENSKEVHKKLSHK